MRLSALLHQTLLATLLLTAGLTLAEDGPTRRWPLPLPEGQGWRIVELREGNGIRHEEYIPRGQGVEDYQDRILLQRMAAMEMNPEDYLAHVSSGVRQHCGNFTTSGLFATTRHGLPSASVTSYCTRFKDRPYGYVLAQKAIRDGEHLLVVEREWRLPMFRVDETGLPQLDSQNPATDEALKRDIRQTMRWLAEQVHPGTPQPLSTKPSPASARPQPRPR
ncbi:hypothetical protein [Zoogloea sp.]|uniref:hypothetical protein n=1 Tax=Zoogloea sp. TaxID=49181 RepID=UPI0026201F9F|nr:hypothetical protein [Zoogloea sp.]MDD3353040.1 hypothetical protein [Zoogloea sp.]